MVLTHLPDGGEVDVHGVDGPGGSRMVLLSHPGGRILLPPAAARQVGRSLVAVADVTETLARLGEARAQEAP